MTKTNYTNKSRSQLYNIYKGQCLILKRDLSIRYPRGTKTDYINLIINNNKLINLNLQIKNKNKIEDIENNKMKNNEQLSINIDIKDATKNIKQKQRNTPIKDEKNREEDKVDEMEGGLTQNINENFPIVENILTEIKIRETQQISAQELINKKVNTTSILEEIAAINIKNDTSGINYNRKGYKGYKKNVISEIFCDNLIIYGLTLDKNCTGHKCLELERYRNYIYAGCRDYLGLVPTPKNIKPVGISKKEDVGVKDINDKNNYVIIDKKDKDLYFIHNPDEKEYYDSNPDETPVFRKQLFKISCPDMEYKELLQNLSRLLLKFRSYGLFLHDIDFTRDYGGSFDKDELINHLIRTRQYKREGDHGQLDEGDKIILNNTHSVGNNCLTYLEKTFDGYINRPKIYNKFVQTMECKGVRTRTGCHIMDWVDNPEQRLKQTIPQTLNTGFLRTEITFYGRLPNYKEIKNKLNELAGILPDELTYKTPIKEQWKEIAKIIKHNLIIYDEQEKLVLLARWVNKTTGKINGIIRKNCTVEDLNYIIKELTFCEIPVDIININLERDKNNKPTNIIMSASSFIKEDKRDCEYKGTAKLTKGTSIYTGYKHHRQDMATFPNCGNMGIVDYKNIKFRVQLKEKNKKFKSKQILRKLPENIFNLILMSPAKKQEKLIRLQQQEQEKIKRERMEMKRKELIILYKKSKTQRDEENKQSKLFNGYFKGIKTNLKDLEDGTEKEIIAIKPISGKYGDSYLLLSMDYKIFYSSNYCKKILPDYINKNSSKLKILKGPEDKNIIYIHKNAETPIFTIKKLYNKLTPSRHYYAYTSIKFNKDLPQVEEDELKEEIKKIENSDKIEYITTNILYKNLDRMEDSITPAQPLTVIGIKELYYRGKLQYAVKFQEINDKIYKANNFLLDILQKQLAPDKRDYIYLVAGKQKLNNKSRRQELLIKLIK